MQRAKAVTIRPDESGGGIAASRPAARAASATGAAVTTFHFVNANPASDSERSQNKVLVRSNASNYHWRRVKKSSSSSTSTSSVCAEPFPSSPTGRPAANVNKRRSTTNRSSESTRPAKRALTPRSPPPTCASSSTDSERSTPKTEQEEQNDQVYITESSPTSSGRGALIILPDASLSSLVVSGHHDPFETYPCDLPKEFVSPVLDQVNSFLSLMFPPERGQSISPLAQEWLRMTFRDRSLFHASLFCQLTRNRIFVSDASASESPEQVQCYSETIRGVHQKFLDTAASCQDENILSVYALSYHGEPRGDPPVEAPSQGPLTTLQLLHIYGGRLRTVNVHLQGLAKMLTLRGGLSKIQLPGLAQAICFGDIIMACQNLTKPMLPYMAMHADVIGPLNAASRKTHPLVGLGRGFRILPDTLGADADEVAQLLVVLRWIIQYTFAVDDSVQGRPEAQKLGYLADERNFVQHSLMLLTPLPRPRGRRGDEWEEEEAVAAVVGEQEEGEDGDEEREHVLVRLSRLGTVIYSLLVVFPLPAVAAPFHRLARQVRTQLSQVALHPSSGGAWTDDRAALDLVLWVTVMGAIAAVGSPDRQWYRTTLDDLTRRLNINTWTSMRERLRMFLWYEYTNDSDGLKLWREIEESNLFRVSK